ncbi:cyclic nucleotide-binding domain-containing protein [Methylobacterium sp. 10]|uniref:cyclic nucleotide-binding domain-containing protein n=1 Tax=Methylobacterium sp. 10 TaxID=1101191 RepID=UPI001FD94FB6|nr:cyclic nucleotide-binding domain-containing protein [Methylobacterium sp. 10]
MLGSGDVFGEVTLLDGQPRTASAAARKPTVLFVIPRRVLLAMMERSHPWRSSSSSFSVPEFVG